MNKIATKAICTFETRKPLSVFRENVFWTKCLPQQPLDDWRWVWKTS